MSEKIIRDPVHDVISLNTADETDRLLFDLLNAAEFQRLRRIRQLGLASLAYPGADHSRYSHSLGVMHTARLMLDRLGRNATVPPEQRQVCLVAALLHDLGHGPFSHVFERVTGIDHERLTARIILDATSQVHQLLIRTDPTLPERTVAALQGRLEPAFLCDVLSSSLDADRLDYLLRDNLMTGSRYGGYDLRWLLQAMTVDASTQRLVVAHKAVSAVEGYLQARYHMYRNVYFHKVVRAAEGMLKLALQRARRLAVQERLRLPAGAEAMAAALTGQRLQMDAFVGLDDVTVTACFKAWTASDDAVLARLCRGLLFRQLYKTIFLENDAGQEGVQEAVAEARSVVDAAGGDADYDLFYDVPADSPYPAVPGESDGIRVILPAGGLIDVAELSPMARALQTPVRYHRLHVSPAYAERVKHAISG
ncbi:MAG: HD domain-containing protein [Phycisphaerae bacterium]